MSLSVAYCIRMLVAFEDVSLAKAFQYFTKPYLMPLVVVLIVPELLLMQFADFEALKDYAPYGASITALWMSVGLYRKILQTASCKRSRAILTTLLAGFVQGVIAGLILR